MWKLMLLAGAGGFIGTCCRFLINRLVVWFWKAPFPLATFIINIIGCFIFGILFGIFLRYGNVPPKLNAIFIVGFCGGFTTFSTFAFETFTLGTNGEILTSIFYAFLSIFIGILAVWSGLCLTR